MKGSIKVALSPEELGLLLRILRYCADESLEWNLHQRDSLLPLSYAAQQATLDRLLNHTLAARDEALAKLKRGDDL